MKLSALTPELYITDFKKSLHFYVDILGFSVLHQRPEEGFASLNLGEAQLMIDQLDKGRVWKTGELEYPLGRGINFEIRVEKIETLLKNLRENNIPLFLEVEERWYRKTDHEVGNKQFLVQDPDGYLLRFYENLGSRSTK